MSRPCHGGFMPRLLLWLPHPNTVQSVTTPHPRDSVPAPPFAPEPTRTTDPAASSYD